MQKITEMNLLKTKPIRTRAKDCGEDSECTQCPNTCIRLDTCEYCICPKCCCYFYPVLDTTGLFRWN